MTLLDILIKAIINKLDDHGSWKTSRDEILELLELDIRDVYRLITESQNPLVSFSTSTFDQNSTGALICLLECFGYDSAPQLFWQAGLWIPYTIQVELQASLIDEISASKSRRKIEYESFLSIFDNFSSLPRSFEIYLEEYFPHDEIIDRAVEKLLKPHSDKSEVNRKLLLKNLSRELFRREIIPYKNLFNEIFIKLKEFLVDKGRIEPPRKKPAPIDESQQKARQLFSYPMDQQIVPKELNQRYKQLMKQYHPDINPSGLEQAKEINRAYSLLLDGI